MAKRFIAVLMGLLIPLCWAGINVYDFATPEQEARFNHLVEELRCPKCQNNNLADSEAPIAKDLKDIIHEQILAGKSDDEIVAFLKARYGDFVSYRPPFKPSTYVIWLGPFFLLIVGAFGVRRYILARRAQQISKDNELRFAENVIQQWREEIEQPAHASEPSSKEEQE